MINIGKKCLAALLAASMVFGVTGCGKQKKAKKPYVQSTAEVKNGTAKAEGKGKQQSEVPLIIGCGRLDKNFNPFLAQAASDEQESFVNTTMRTIRIMELRILKRHDVPKRTIRYIVLRSEMIFCLVTDSRSLLTM